MKIRVLVPACDIVEKVEDKTGRLGRQLFRLEGKGEFISAVQRHQRVIAILMDQFDASPFDSGEPHAVPCPYCGLETIISEFGKQPQLPANQAG